MYNDILGDTPKKKIVSPPLPPPMQVQAGAAKIPHKKRTHPTPTMKSISKVLVKDFGLDDDCEKEDEILKAPDCDCEDGSCEDCGQEAEEDDKLEELELVELDFDEDELEFEDDDDTCQENCKSCEASAFSITSTKLTPKLREIDPWHMKAGYKKGKLKVIGLITDNIKLGFNSRKEDV